jgi:NADH:ubiquinone oxidoreductase subunit E
MPADDEPVEIAVCLGSSCFARGNSAHLAAIKDYIENRGLDARVCLCGHLCQDECKQGPNVSIGGERHHEVTAPLLRELLDRMSQSLRGGHGTA